MGTPIKRIGKILAVLYVGFLLLSLLAGSANAIPTAEDINSLAGKAKLAADTFMQESFQIRMRYEYSSKFLTQDDKENLQKIAKRTSNQLAAIAQQQKKLKQQIEDYEADDWDAKYGQTGLWRKLSVDIYYTKLSKYEADFYEALTDQNGKTDEKLKKILPKIELLNQNLRYKMPVLLKGKILAVLSQTDHAYKESALKEFGRFGIYSDIYRPIKAQIEIIKLTGQAETKEFNALSKILQQNKNEELILELSFLQSRYDPCGFEKTVRLWPQTEDFLGSLMLSDLSGQITQGQLTKQALQRISTFEAELAVEAAWKSQARNYKILLERLLAVEKFQTPLILYVTAVALAESSPAKAVDLLIKAGKLQLVRKSKRLNITADKIAEQAAQLAYKIFVQNQQSCRLALRAFENYIQMAGNKVDEEMQYLYTVVLNDCGQITEGKRLLEKIADRSDGKWRDKARFELIAKAIQQKQVEKPEQKSKLARQFSSLITDSNNCEYAGEAIKLLSSIFDEFEQVQADCDNPIGIIQDCKRIAKFCYECSADRQAGLFLAEVLAITADKEKKKLSTVEKLLKDIGKGDMGDDVDLLRCRARLLRQQGKYNEAAVLWAKVAEIRKSQTPSANKRSWKWWRAKFYELACWAKRPQTEKENVLHTIEVLEKSFEIPELWAEKLSLLKQQCRSQSIGESN